MLVIQIRYNYRYAMFFQINEKVINTNKVNFYFSCFLGIGNWVGDGDWGVGPIPNPQSPIPNPPLYPERVFKY